MTAEPVGHALSVNAHYPPATDRRHALLELAEAVVIERGHNGQPWTNVIPLVVPTLAADACRNVLVAFHDLCEAVAERHRFVADPDAWLVEHEQPLGDRTFERYDAQTETAVQFELDRLMGARS